MSLTWLDHQMLAANQGKIALIDIGSNSIRLVVYDRLKRAPASIYNEKVMCQLGKGLALTGKLNPEGMVMARRAVARYVALAKNMEVTELDVFATAAVRDASDGQAFVDELERQHNIYIEVISGRREAKLGAYGILSAMHEPTGLIGDLGGGSLELVALDSQQHISERVSLPIGALRLLDECADLSELRSKVRTTLAKETWLTQQPWPVFYAIGGSFRNLARMHMQHRDYPLALVHGYTVPPAELSNLLARTSHASNQTLAGMPGASNKRLGMLPAAAIILDELLQHIRPQHVTFSQSGIREGYLYEKLSPFVRSEDVLIASCIEFAGKMHHSISYAKELYEWLQRVLKKQSDSSMRLAYAFCLMQDVARYINPDDRAVWAFGRIVQSNFYGMNHKQRVQLGLALYHFYCPRLKHTFPELRLLDQKSQAWAQLLGTLASLAHHLSGGTAGPLENVKLEFGKQKCKLILPEAMQPLLGDIIDKRLIAIHESYHAWREFK